MHRMLVVLSEDAAEGLFREVLPWTLLGIAILVVGMIALMMLRRIIHHDDGSDSEAFTLQTLRDLHASGELTDEQYQKARDSMIGRVTGLQHAPDAETSIKQTAKPEQTGGERTDFGADSDLDSGDDADKQQDEEPDNGPSDKPPRSDV